MSNKYDYIITGTGCAGLSLAVHMIRSGKFSDKQILLVDKDAKQKNDRTWCFWEKEPGIFEEVVNTKYSKAWVHDNDFSRLLDLAPYEYKLIHGINFYSYCLTLIRQHSNFQFLYGEIKSINSDNNKTWIECEDEVYHADFIFNSILFGKPLLKNKEYWLLQHFKGITIETSNDVFTPGQATLMDFRVPQTHGTSFVYIMPFASNRVLVEYTLFSEKQSATFHYDSVLGDYISNHVRPGTYKIVEEEVGVIPMTNHKFVAVRGNIVNIGTAGGQTKGSSGYTFRFIQKHSARIVESLVKKNNPFIALPAGPARYHFYDSVLLRILNYKNVPGNKIFTKMFQKNNTQQILRFLDNESSYLDDLKIISSLPTWPFLKAAIKQLT